MKTILFISHSSSLTGAPLLLRDLAARLDKRKYDVRFLLGDDGPLRPHFEEIGPTIVEPLYPDEVKYWREIRRIARRFSLLRRLKPDLLYCNTIHPAKWLVYARLLGIPTLTHVHELSMGFAALGRTEHRIVRSFSQHVIAVSEAVKRYLVETIRIPAGRIRVVRLGIEPSRFVSGRDRPDVRKSLGLENAFVIGTVGRITAMKGSDLLAEAASLVRAKAPPSVCVKFLVVATTDDREYTAKFRALLVKHDLRSDVIVLENQEEVADCYRAMDVYISTAREDPFPLVVLEAMASGVPVVAFAAGGIPEQVTPECGVLVEPLNVEAMAKALLSLMERPEVRRSMGAAGRARVAEQFDMGQNIVQIEEIIDAAARSSAG